MIHDIGYGHSRSMLGYKLGRTWKILIKVDLYGGHPHKNAAYVGHKENWQISERLTDANGNLMDGRLKAAVNILKEGKREDIKKCA